MESNFDFKNHGNDPRGEGRWTQENYPLPRQPSLYSLTLDELQNTMRGSLGKDFGSMNMDELLKSIWNAEESQTMWASHSGAGQGGGGGGGSSGYLQRQGSLTLPRTLSRKTVDEVWNDMSKEFVSVTDGNGVGGSSMAQRERTLGDTTLEEFLVKAGVVREDVQLAKNSIYNPGAFGDLALDGSNSVLNFSFQQPDRSVGLTGGNQQQQPTLDYGVSVAMPTSGGLGSQRIMDGIVKTSEQAINNNTSQNSAPRGGGMGVVGLGAGGLTVASGSPAGNGKSNGELSSISPAPYVFNGGFRGRKSSTLEKVVERRQRRMIKNRESAARSRARKQAYTMELEEEVAKLKEENEELMKKQAKMIEMQKSQVLEAMIAQPSAKRRSLLRRVQTSPW